MKEENIKKLAYLIRDRDSLQAEIVSVAGELNRGWNNVKLVTNSPSDFTGETIVSSKLMTRRVRDGIILLVIEDLDLRLKEIESNIIKLKQGLC